MLLVKSQFSAKNLHALDFPYERSYEEAASSVRKFKVRHPWIEKVSWR
jgi:hypothetical protein